MSLSYSSKTLKTTRQSTGFYYRHKRYFTFSEALSRIKLDLNLERIKWLKSRIFEFQPQIKPDRETWSRTHTYPSLLMLTSLGMFLRKTLRGRTRFVGRL